VTTTEAEAAGERQRLDRAAILHLHAYHLAPQVHA
jgi:hypothetical protein